MQSLTLQPYQSEQTANLQPVDLIAVMSKHVDSAVLRTELLSVCSGFVWFIWFPTPIARFFLVTVGLEESGMWWLIRRSFLWSSSSKERQISVWQRHFGQVSFHHKHSLSCMQSFIHTSTLNCSRTATELPTTPILQQERVYGFTVSFEGGLRSFLEQLHIWIGYTKEASNKQQKDIRNK